jgi:hypothetical protein
MGLAHCLPLKGARAILLSGDHAIVVGLVEGALTRAGDPLLYFGGKYGTFAEPEAESGHTDQASNGLERPDQEY